jgi:hypothetical protein
MQAGNLSEEYVELMWLNEARELSVSCIHLIDALFDVWCELDACEEIEAHLDEQESTGGSVQTVKVIPAPTIELLRGYKAASELFGFIGAAKKAASEEVHELETEASGVEPGMVDSDSLEINLFLEERIIAELETFLVRIPAIPCPTTSPDRPTDDGPGARGASETHETPTSPLSGATCTCRQRGQGESQIRTEADLRTACGRVDEDYIYSSQADLARHLGLATHYSGLMESLLNRRQLRSCERIARSMFKYQLANPSEHTRIKREIELELAERRRNRSRPARSQERNADCRTV